MRGPIVSRFDPSFRLCLRRALNLLPVVPHGDTSHCPLPPYIVVIGGVDVQVDEFEEFVRFLLLEFSEACGKALVDVQCLQSGNWMRSDSRMMRIDRRSIRSDSPEVENSFVCS